MRGYLIIPMCVCDHKAFTGCGFCVINDDLQLQLMLMWLWNKSFKKLHHAHYYILQEFIFFQLVKSLFLIFKVLYEVNFSLCHTPTHNALCQSHDAKHDICQHHLLYVHLVFYIDSLDLRLKLTKFKITVRTD